MRNTSLKHLSLGLAVFAVSACGGDEVDPPVTPVTPGTIAEVATASGFSTLVSAAGTAGLVPALAGDDPLTVFAPTDEAFAALGAAVPSDPGLLANVLLSHVVAGKLDSAAVTSGSAITSLAKTPIVVDAAASPITVNGFDLSATLDVEASNGIIHVLDQVIVPPTILEVAAATDDLSTLVAAVGASSQGVKDALAAGGPMTVFAPVNSAFAKIPTADLDALLADQPALDGVLTQHVVMGQALSTDLSDGQTLTTAAGTTLTVGITSAGATLTDAAGNVVNIVDTDIRLLNGTVHLIDSVLMPEAAEPPKNIVEVATDIGGFSSLLGAATSAGLAATLSDGGPFTVFAPTDAAFTALGVDLTPVSTDVIANILLHHVVGGSVASGEVVGSASLATAANTSLAVDASGTPITIGGSNLSSTLDVPASNGIIHVMDAVIVPPTIVEVAQATPDLSVLLTAVGAASATVQGAIAPNTLGGDSPITVFAPTNAAFVASGIDLNTVPQADLDGVLAHHVVGSQAVSTGLSDGDVVTTLNGTITVEIDAQGAIAVVDGQGNRANVVATLKDIRTLTGVVHVIDAVLLP